MSNLNVETTNANEEAKPNASLSGSGSGSIEGVEGLSKLLDAKLNEALKPVLAEVRGVQSRQDKDRGAFREFLDEYKKQKAKGLTDSEAESAADMVLKEKSDAAKDKELLRLIADKVLNSSAAGTGAAPQTIIDVSEYGLDASDPEVLSQVLSLTDKKEAELAALRLERKRRQASSTPAVASPITGTPSRPAGAEQLIEQYHTDMLAARGKPEQLRAIKEKARKAGVPVDSVMFS